MNESENLKKKEVKFDNSCCWAGRLEMYMILKTALEVKV
jgi:hypothetical protein